MKYRSLYLWLLMALALLFPASLTGQTAQTATRTATVEGDKMTLDLRTNEIEFTGHCKLTIAGPYQVRMTAGRMTFKLSAGADSIERLTTHEATNFSLVTQPAEAEQQYQITAAAGGATYSEKAQQVVLSGGAQADIVSLPEGPQSQRAQVTGETITADLRTSIIEVNKAHLRVETPQEAE